MWSSPPTCVAQPSVGKRLLPNCATGRLCPIGRSAPPCQGIRRSWLMLVVSLSKVVLARSMLPAENVVNVVQGRNVGSFFHLPNVDFHFAGIGKLHLFGRAINAFREH